MGKIVVWGRVMIKRRQGAMLNTDIDSYEFDDLDLEMAVGSLPEQERRIVTLWLMGFTYREIGALYAVSQLARRIDALRTT